VHCWAPERRLVVVGDRTYAALELLDAVRSVAAIVARLRLDAQLFAPPLRRPGQTGRPRLVDDRLPNLTEHAANEEAGWIPLTSGRWYGERDRPIEALLPWPRPRSSSCSGARRSPAHRPTRSRFVLRSDGPGGLRPAATKPGAQPVSGDGERGCGVGAL